MTQEARLEQDESIEDDETVTSEQLTRNLEEALGDVSQWTHDDRALRTSFVANDEWHILAETRSQTECRHNEGTGQPVEAEAFLQYDAEADSMLIRITSTSVSRKEEAIPGVILSYDGNGRVVSIEVLTASKRIGRSDVQEAA